MFEPEYGAQPVADGTRIRVWAPGAAAVAISAEKLAAPLALALAGGGNWEVITPALGPGDRYRVHIDGGAGRPDPVSRLLPEGVHGPTEIVDPGAYVWQDAGWRGIALADCIFYELHVGTFTAAGTFAGVRERLPWLKALGITCIELMPVAQFPGRRNRGYDGVSLYAVQESYGGPEELKALVDACHREGLAVCLDVVYNHLGPERAIILMNSGPTSRMLTLPPGAGPSIMMEKTAPGPGVCSAERAVLVCGVPYRRPAAGCRARHL
jgi:malto-oligosyltrehalose trehalohydrolase